MDITRNIALAENTDTTSHNDLGVVYTADMRPTSAISQEPPDVLRAKNELTINLRRLIRIYDYLKWGKQ